MTSVREEIAELRGQFVAAGFATGWGVLKSVPEPVASRLFREVADVATKRNGGSVRQLRTNLRRVVGPSWSDAELEDLVKEAMRSYARYWLETFRLPKMDKAYVAAQVDANAIGAEHIDAALAQGRGFILALPHTGNYDVAGLWLVDRYGSFTTVAERLKPESLFDRFVAYRQSLGMEVLPLTGGDTPPTGILAERLRSNQGVCLVADRDLSRHGLAVDFFGETARLPAGPAMLAAMTGAALLPVGLWFTEDGSWGQRIGPPIELPEGGRLRDRVQVATQRLADEFAQLISAHPAHWHMLQKLWVADLDPDARVG